MLTRSFFLASAAALIASSPALAVNPYVAPTEVTVSAPVMSDPAYSWAGGYAGVNLGYSGDEAEHPFSVTNIGPSGPLNGSLDINSSGFTGGVQAGWNFQNNGFVYGVEADYQASNVEGKASFNVAGPGGAVSGEIGTKLKSFGTIRARVGHTVTDRFFVYGTAGFARGETQSSVSVTGLGSTSVKKTENGWTAGIGAEYAFNDKMSLKTEYIYTDLGTADLYSGAPFGAGGPIANLDREFNFHTVRVGLNFHF